MNLMSDHITRHLCLLAVVGQGAAQHTYRVEIMELAGEDVCLVGLGVLPGFAAAATSKAAIVE